MKEKKLPTLREAREERGVSQSLLAKYSTVDQAKISRIEQEFLDPPFGDKIRLSFALNMLVDQIAWPEMPKKATRIPGLEEAEDDQGPELKTEGAA